MFHRIYEFHNKYSFFFAKIKTFFCPLYIFSKKVNFLVQFLEKHKNSPSKYSHSSLISPLKRNNFASLSRRAFQTSKHEIKVLKMM